MNTQTKQDNRTEERKNRFTRRVYYAYKMVLLEAEKIT